MKVIKQTNLLESLPILPTAVLLLILNTGTYSGWYWFLFIIYTIYIWYHVIKKRQNSQPVDVIEHLKYLENRVKYLEGLNKQK